MATGPFEFLLISFAGERFKANVVNALIDLVEFGTVRVVDFVVLRCGADGNTTTVEIDDLDDELRELFFELDGEYGGLLSEADLALAAQTLAPGHTAVGIVWEELWAARFAETVGRAGGTVLLNERLSHEAVEAAM